MVLGVQIDVRSPAKRAIGNTHCVLVLLISVILILCEKEVGRDLKYFKITRITCFECVIKTLFQYFTLMIPEHCQWQICSAEFCFIQG